MLAALIPLFNSQMAVKGYSIFAQKDNYFVTPNYTGVGRFDGASNITGLDVVDAMGMETLSGDLEVFIELNSVSIFRNIHSIHINY